MTTTKTTTEEMASKLAWAARKDEFFAECERIGGWDKTPSHGSRYESLLGAFEAGMSANDAVVAYRQHNASAKADRNY